MERADGAANRATTGVAGLDAILDGGLLTETVCLVAGPPGSGKTTLGNQIAYHHARGGGVALVATLLAEGHEALIARLRSFAFFDATLPSRRVYYLSLVDALETGGLEGMLAATLREARERRAELLVLDGASLLEQLAVSPVEYARFVQQLGVACRLLGCTVLILSGRQHETLATIGPHVDAVIELDMESNGARDLRTLRVVKYRGVQHVLGRHDMTIDDGGVSVHPRLEALAGRERADRLGPERLTTGIAGLDRMLGGGVLSRSTTMLLGSPGAGKTLLGLHFLAAGAADGDRGLIATFHEKPGSLADAAASIGLDLEASIAREHLRIFWSAPLELSPDEWAWRLLGEIAEHRPARLLIDGVSDVYRLLLRRDRMTAFVPALANELRRLDVTTYVTVELDEFVGPDLTSPVPAVSAAVDNAVLLRHVELRSRLQRLITVLKSRQSTADPSIREVTINGEGVGVGGVFGGAAALLTGAPAPIPSGDFEPAAGSGL